MENTGLIFVYGTLKIGGYYASYFDNYRLNSEKGWINGEIYDLRHFPALVLGGDNKVYGEIHKYGKFNEVIRFMDQIEGYRENNIPESLYVRKTIKAFTEKGKTVKKVIVYEAGEEIRKELDRLDSKLLVKSGIW